MSTGGDIAGRTRVAGRSTGGSDWFERGVRFGLVAYGMVYLVLAWLAFQLALGDYEGQATTKGAVAQLAEQPGGTVLIVLVATGMFVLVVWRLFEAVAGHPDDDGADLWKHRAADLLKAVIYGLIGWSAVSVLTHSGGGSGGAQGFSATVLGWPGGPFLLGLAGLAVVAYGGNQVWHAWSEKFQEKLATEGRTGEAGKAYLLFGKIGYVAKGIAIGLVGALLVYAAITQDPDKSGSTDKALHKVLEQPFGPYLLMALAVGIACYALFTFARARHLSR
jgi:hypothetical protein